MKMKNAADESQVRDAEGKMKRARTGDLEDVRFLLTLPQGRRFIWRLLSHCSVFESIWHPSALIHHNAGRQDVGHFILREVNDANAEAMIEMMKENKKEKE